MDKVTKEQAERVIHELEHVNRTLGSFLKLANRGQQHKPSTNDQEDAAEENSHAHTGTSLPIPDIGPSPETSSQSKHEWYSPKYWWGRSFVWWKPRVEFTAIFFAIGYAIVTYLQWHDARVNFRADQRPYLAMAFSESELIIPVSGEHKGQIKYQFPIQIFGKSPAIMTGLDAHVSVGREDAKNVGFHPVSEHYYRILAPGDKPQFFAYSRNFAGDAPPNTVIKPEEPIILYGHFEYIDTLSGNSPTYILGFCIPIKIDPANSSDVERTCERENYIK